MSDRKQTRRLPSASSLAGQKTTAYVPPPAETPPRAAKKPARKTSLWPWLLGAGAALVVLSAGGAVVVAVLLMLSARKAPQVEVDPAVKQVRFGTWQKMRGENRFTGWKGDMLVADVTAGNAPIKDEDLQVEQYDAAGKKLNGREIVFPNLKAGETAQSQVTLSEGAAKVIIRPRK